MGLELGGSNGYEKKGTNRGYILEESLIGLAGGLEGRNENKVKRLLGCFV